MASPPFRRLHRWCSCCSCSCCHRRRRRLSVDVRVCSMRSLFLLLYYILSTSRSFFVWVSRVFFLILLLIFFNWLNPDFEQMRERFHFFKERFSPSFEEERKPCELLLARHIRTTSVIFRTQTHFYLHHTHKTCPRSPKSRTDASPSRL